MTVNRDPIGRCGAILGLLTVVAANARYLGGFAEVFDPPHSMEPYYIELAKLPVASIVTRDPAWGPLYGLWLKPLRLVLEDPLQVYATNVEVLSYLVSALVYLCSLLLTRRVELATATALLFVISDLNVPLESKVCAFAVAVVLAGVALSELVARRASRSAIAGLGLLVASHARPELYAPGVVLWCVAVCQARPLWRSAGSRWIVAGSLAIVLVAIAVGTPLWSADSENDRLFSAFREHFARNWGRWNDGWRPYLSVWDAEFGAADSMVRALLVNPTAVAHHLWDNAGGVLWFLAIGVFDHYPVILPQNWAISGLIESLFLSVAFATLVASICAEPTRRRFIVEHYGHLALMFAVVAVFSLGAATVVFPKAHYMAVPGVLWILATGVAASAVLPRWSPQSRWAAAVAALACVAATPRPYSQPRIDRGPTGIGAEVRLFRPVTDTVHQIRSLGLTRPVHVLTFTDGFGELLGPGFDEIKIWNKGDRSLETYVREAHVDVIVTMERGRNSFLVDDPFWTLIETDPAKAGFTALTTGDPRSVRVYVRGEVPRESDVSAGSR